jgi:hypothetical protein
MVSSARLAAAGGRHCTSSDLVLTYADGKTGYRPRPGR